MRRALRRARCSPSIYVSGIGPRAADATAAAALASGSTPRRALVTGLCGALSPAFGVGDSLLYATIADATGERVQTDRLLSAAVQEAVPGVQSGVRGFASESVISSPAEKREAARRFEVDAVDMESFSLVRELAAAGWGVAVLRVVSDALDDSLPDLGAALDADGRFRPVPLALACARRPGAALGMARNAVRALGALRRDLGRVFEALGPS